MLEELKAAPEKVVGLKQLRKALHTGRAKKVFLALDADPALTEPLAEECKKQGIEVVPVPSMKQLGAAFSIAVDAAVAAIL